MSEHIEIRTVADIKEKIPADKLDAFLADLKTWVLETDQLIANTYLETLKAVGSSMGVSIQVNVPKDVIYWVDDGQVGLSEIVTTYDDKELSVIKIYKEKTDA